MTCVNPALHYIGVLMLNIKFIGRFTLVEPSKLEIGLNISNYIFYENAGDCNLLSK